MSAADLLSIGEVAEATGVAVTAIRYYDEVGVVRPTARVGGKRRFDAATIGRLNFVRRAQEAGFGLDEIRAMLDDRGGGWRSLVDTKLGELQDRRRRLDDMIDMLVEMRECGCDAVASCPRVTA